ncbi:MAG: tripartite tricarboxylate transporter substrate-binding protein [Pseudomonadota bacterium]
MHRFISSLSRSPREWLRALAALALLAAGCAHAEWPDRPVHLVVPYAPGGGVDNIARIISPPLTKLLGQPIIIDNKPGANANIGAEFVAKAQPDGYNLLVGATFLAANRASMTGLGYDSVRDLTPVARLGRSASVLVVSSSLPVHSVKELVEYAKANPKDISYASVGAASPNALIFARNTGIQPVPVLYKGGAAAMPDLIAGRVTFMLGVISESMPNIQGGKLRALAVTGTERLKQLPEVPTMAQAGVANLTNTGWWGVFAPAKTPAAVNERLSTAIQEVMRMPEVISSMSLLGIDAAFLNVSGFGSFYKSEMSFYEETAKTFDIKQK